MTTYADNSASSQSDDIDLLELWNVLWSGRLVIGVVTICFAIVAVIYASTRTDIYRAEALLAPAVNREANNPLAGQLGAALVGVDLGQQSQGAEISSVLATLRSREFILDFVEANNLRELLVPGIAADAGAAGDWKIYRTFSDILDAGSERETGLIHVSIEWHDPVQAADWVNMIVAAINAHERQRDVKEAAGAVEYLKGQLSSTQLVEMQRVFYQLIESQTRIIMLADVRDEYVFRVIDPAVVSDKPSYPNRTAIVILWTLAGLVVAVLFILAKYFVTAGIRQAQSVRAKLAEQRG